MTFGKVLSPDSPLPASDPPEAPGPLTLRHLSVDDRQWELHQRGILGTQPHTGNFSLKMLTESDDAIENAIGYVGVPLGLLPSLIVNGVERIVPMATEERSVIASAAKAAGMCKGTGGVVVHASLRPTVSVQIFFASPRHPRSLQRKLFELLYQIEALANECGGHMEARGGAPVSVGAAYVTGANNEHVVLPMEFDTCDAMGANVVTRVAENVAARLHSDYGLPRRTAAICSNDESGWRVIASAVWPHTDNIRIRNTCHVAEWAESDMLRAVTHNKGIMNGITAVALATGQDTRAIEACAHASALRNGTYAPLSRFGVCTALDDTKTMAVGGTLTMRIPCGTAGGATRLPYYKECLDILGNPNARELACIMAATGLVQNFAALWSLAGEGIPASHERLSHK